MSRVIRASALDVVPDRVLASGASVHGRAVDTLGDGGAPLRAVEFRAVVDDDGRLASMDGSGDLLADLVGRPVGRGFRAALTPLGEAGPTGRLLRRLLWDLPILTQVAGQTALLDHDAARAELQLSRRGTDQCSGWRADGEMMRQVDRNAGVLVMPLGPVTPSRSLAQPWLTDVGALPPMATRRSRVLELDEDPSGRVPLTVGYRDTYADPDGVSRALHEWTVRTELVGRVDDLRFADFAVEAGRLPWVECPIAGGSATRLEGVGPADVERIIGQDFGGISTCTHLNDTLRGLTELPDLLAVAHA